MKRNLLKTMLVAVGMVAGMSGAWAADDNAVVKMTYVDYDNPSTAIGEIAAGETAKAGYNKISGGAVDFGNTGWGENKITYIQVDASAIEGTITGAMLTAEVSGISKTTNGVVGDGRAGIYGVGYNSSTWSSNLTYETADRTITTMGATYTTKSKRNANFENATFDISGALVGDEDKIVTILVYETNAGSGDIKNPSVTVTYLSEDELCTYTVKYVCGDIEVKESKSGKAGIDSYYTVTDEDKASVKVDDVKYIYESDDAASQEIAEDGNTVITIKFREAAKLDCVVNAIDGDGNVLKELAKQEGFEGESYTIYYTKAFEIDGKWYMTEQASGTYYGVSVVAGTSKNILYKKWDVDYFVEVEDMNTSAGDDTWSNGGYPNRYANGIAKCLKAKTYIYTTLLPSGIYNVTLGARNEDSRNTLTTSLSIRNESGELSDLASSTFEEWATGSTTAKTVTVVIPDKCSLAIRNTTNSNSKLALDYICLIKIGEATESVSVSDAGLATFCSNYALDFTNVENIWAYRAELSGDKVTLVRAKGVVNAGEGILLRSLTEDAQTANVPVTSESVTERNDFVGTVEAKHIDPTEGNNTNYVLAKVNGELCFSTIADGGITLRANSAYLPVPSSTAKSIRMVFGDDVTGINDVKTDAVKDNDVFYTLSGVRVLNPTKGLYIQNGKKVVIK